MDPLVAALPWALLCVWALVRLLPGPRLSTYPVRRRGHHAPHVSVIVPTNNDGHDIGACLGTILASEYPALDVIVVDVGSTDGTVEVAEAVAALSERVRVLAHERAPADWRARAWECWSGARAAEGELLLFTHADTRHDPELLPRAVAALERRGAALVSVLPRHDLQTMAERILLPHLLLTINARFVDARLVNRARSPRNALANPQYLLVRRGAYFEAGGHDAVRERPAPELGIAQRLRALGRGVYLVHGERFLVTRMFRSLSEISAGWTRILAMGASTALRSRLIATGPWIVGVLALAMWLVPPALTIFAWGSPLGPWARYATGFSLVFWALTYARHMQPVLFALTYPLGAIATAILYARAALHPESGGADSPRAEAARVGRVPDESAA
jgi:chlorobactene glucosyltransferase